MEEIDRRFDIIETIGEGTYGVVFKAYDKKLNKVSFEFQIIWIFINLILIIEFQIIKVKLTVNWLIFWLNQILKFNIR